MEIFKQFTFDSAHFLPNVPEGHKCKQIHGHTYHMTVYVEGDLKKDFGWVIDFAEVKSVIEPIVKSIDHKLLNDIPGLENPTCEIVTTWLWDKIKPKISILSKIELHETLTSGAIYKGR